MSPEIQAGSSLWHSTWGSELYRRDPEKVCHVDQGEGSVEDIITQLKEWKILSQILPYQICIFLLPLPWLTCCLTSFIVGYPLPRLL